MKWLKWILLGVVLYFAWKWYKASRLTPAQKTALNDPSATSVEDQAAVVQATNRDRQSVHATNVVLLPQAQNVRVNGALLDMNRLGGNLPSLFTAPVLPSFGWPASNN